MRPIVVLTARGIAVGLLLVAAAAAARAQSWEDKYHRAFYLETAEGDFAAAAKLYRQVAAAEEAPADLRDQARGRWQACREEVLSADFARLMPPQTLIYAELSRPGEQLVRLLESLGLLAAGEPSAGGGRAGFGISPRLVEGLFGLRGAAVAVTGFDPVNHAPTGVAVFHPGKLEVLRGLIATALPVGSLPVKPIGGFATYELDRHVLVTLTRRLVVVSPQRGLIVNVVRRLGGAGRESLADNQALAAELAQRQDALLFFCVNAKPIMPLLNALLAAGGRQSRELATARAVLDLDSLRCLSGRLGVSKSGAFLDLTLRLDKGHHNLLYNLLRLPPVDQRTLRYVPRGAAGFLAAALNRAGAPPGAVQPPGAVTALDFGRELFANVVGLAVYVLPPEQRAAGGAPPLPDVAAAISVRDPGRSEALWRQVLGVASVASGAGAAQGTRIEIAGTPVQVYRLGEGLTAYLARLEDALLVAASRSAMARSLAARQSGASIVDDPALAPSLSRIGADSTLALFVHPGRCARIAERFAPQQAAAQIRPWSEVLQETVASAVVSHSAEVLHVSAQISGLPDVSGLLMQAIRQQQRRRQLLRAMRQRRWDEALETVEALAAEQPAPEVGLLLKKFRILAVGKRDRPAALAVGGGILDQAGAGALNDLAWALLTEPQYGGQYDELALRLSRRANELTGLGVWQYVDTLALAEFKAGEAAAAIELEKKALALCPPRSPGRQQLEAALARFEAALGRRAGAAREGT